MKVRVVRLSRSCSAVLVLAVSALALAGCGKKRPFGTIPSDSVAADVPAQNQQSEGSAADTSGDLSASADGESDLGAIEADCSVVGCPDPLTCRLAEAEFEANRCVECIDNAQCPDALPVCDPNTNECTARCTTSTQCNAPTPVCDEQTQTCVGCLDDGDCIAELRSGGSCRSDDARCVECLSDAQCVGEPAASNCSSDGFCVVCLANEDCSLVQGRSNCLPNIGCVECVDANDCVGNTSGPVCKDSNAGQATADAPVNTCVECTSNEHCQANAVASLCQNNQCVPCVQDADCSLVNSDGNAPAGANLNVCDAGTCVECTGTKNGACANGTSACNSLTKACSNFPVGRASLCGTCVSDAQCAPDSRCVQIELGFFCLPLQVNELCPNEGATRGFVGQLSTTTVDTASADVCVPRRATCPAFAAYRGPTECDDADDDAACGTGGVCGQIPNGGNDFLCTIPCIAASDCLSGSCFDDLCTL